MNSHEVELNDVSSFYWLSFVSNLRHGPPKPHSNTVPMRESKIGYTCRLCFDTSKLANTSDETNPIRVLHVQNPRHVQRVLSHHILARVLNCKRPRDCHVWLPCLSRSLSNPISHTLLSPIKPPNQRERLSETLIDQTNLHRAAAMASSSRVLLCFSLFIALCFSGIHADEAESKEFVLTLDSSNFSDTVSKHDFVVVEFYAPWYKKIRISFF